MTTQPDFQQALRRLFNRKKVVELKHLFTTLKTHSRMTVFRKLSGIEYLTSYSQAGRYYTLQEISQFDHDGLWQFNGILFSRDGTLKQTVIRMINDAEAGQFHKELQRRLRLRVHNTLAELVEKKQIDRLILRGEFLYINVDPACAAKQIAARTQLDQRLMATKDLDPTLIIEVLMEVIHGSIIQLDAQQVADRLMARGITINISVVEEVFRRYSVQKKTARSRSRRLER